jgi:hypothetical protein
MDKDMFLQLFKSLVRTHLEYGSTVWSVANKKEAIIIENVQRRDTRLIKEIQHLSYGNRLKHLGLPTLQYRRIRADVVETFKIIKVWTKSKSTPYSPKIILQLQEDINTKYTRSIVVQIEENTAFPKE